MMLEPALKIEGVMRAGELYRRQEASRGGWGLEGLSGRVVELSEGRRGGLMTVAVELVLEAQQAGEPVAWVSASEASFFPPDVAAQGVDLGALPVVLAKGVSEAGRAADKLVRSGGFGMVVLDLPAQAYVPGPLMQRLGRLAGEEDVAVVCLTRSVGRGGALGSFVSLRGVVEREQVGEDRFCCRVQVVRDRRRAPGWRWEEERCGPPGLR